MKTSDGGHRIRHSAFQLPRLTVLAALVFSTSCSAQGHETWGCSTPTGSYANYDLQIGPATCELTGTLVFLANSSEAEWAASAKLVFKDSTLEDAGCKCNGLKAIVSTDDPTRVIINLIIDGEEREAVSMAYDKPIPFTLTFAEDHALSLKVGTQTMTGMPTYFRHDQIAMRCQSANVSFRDINPQ